MHNKKNAIEKKYVSIKQSRVILSLYIIAYAFIIIMVIYLAMSSGLSDFTDEWTDGATDNVIFYDEQGNVIHDSMNLYTIANSSSIYTTIPLNLPEDFALCFRTKHAYVDAFINDKPVYETKYAESRFYTDSAGTTWVRIPFKASDRGCALRIDYTLAYDQSNCGIRDAVYCKAEGFILNEIYERLPSLFICMAYVVIGVILITIGIIASRFIKNDYSLFWLGALTLSVAMYCFFETQVLQIFVSNTRLIHLCVMFSMAMIPVPAIAYGSSFLEYKFKSVAFSVMIISFVSFFILTLLNALNITDYHTNILVLQVLIILAMIILGIGIIGYILNYIHRQKKTNIYVTAMIIGLLCIIITGFVDIIRYWKHDDGNAASYLRIGFFGFLICFSIASCERIVYAFQTSIHAKVISKLAYEDGLTGLKNRTSYQEKIDSIEANKTPTGVIMMDLNNLKHVNDTFGHEDGDALIINAAKLIKKSFAIPCSDCYRIGGDEFVVLIQDQNDDTKSIDIRCRECISILRQSYCDFNDSNDEPYDVIIACGYDIYESGKTFKATADVADSLMYEDKRQLKAAKH